MAAAGQVFDELRCGFPPSLFRPFLGRVIGDFVERYSNLMLSVSEGHGGTLITWVREGVLEFAVGGWDAADIMLESSMVFEEALVLVSGTPVFGPQITRCDLQGHHGYKLMLPMHQSRHQAARPSGTASTAANAALYQVGIVRMCGHLPTLDYVHRRAAEGKSKSEIIRCLKRYVAREIFGYLCTKPAMTDATATSS